MVTEKPFQLFEKFNLNMVNWIQIEFQQIEYFYVKLLKFLLVKA